MMVRRRPHPRLTEDDAALWRQVARTVRPLHQRVPEPEAPAESEQGEASGHAQPSKVPPSGRGKAKRRSAPPLAPVDRRLMRRVGRGREGVDATLDLHGLTQEQAFYRLYRFLERSRATGHRLVLVVTGKGRRDETGDWWEEGRRGVLREAVPAWLETPEFRDLVVGYRHAHDRRGGEGALYIQLRRRRARE